MDSVGTWFSGLLSRDKAGQSCGDPVSAPVRPVQDLERPPGQEAGEEHPQELGWPMNIIVDIDHTLSDAIWRDHLISAAKETGSWDHYHSLGYKDQPHVSVCSLVRSFYALRWGITAITGRPEKWRDQTRIWLQKHQVPVDELLMRPHGDHTPSGLMKVRIIRQNFPDLSQVAFILEDRPDCVAELKKLGIPILQVHNGLERQTRQPAQDPPAEGRRL